MCYLPPEVIAEYDIRIVPINLLWDGETYREGVDIDTDAFFQKLATNVEFPTTSQPASEAFLLAWKPLLEAGHEVITVLLSGRLSGVVTSAQAARQLLPEGAPISIIDSASVAMGLGMQVLRAAELARIGAARSAIVAAVDRMREAIHIILMVDTLEHLRRGGRINSAAAWLGTLLHVKPLLSLQNGVLEPLEQVRTIKRACARQLEWVIARLDGDARPWIAVMYSRSSELAEGLLATLRPRFPNARFFFSEIGPVLAAHLGTGVGIIACHSAVL